MDASPTERYTRAANSISMRVIARCASRSHISGLRRRDATSHATCSLFSAIARANRSRAASSLRFHASEVSKTATCVASVPLATTDAGFARDDAVHQRHRRPSRGRACAPTNSTRGPSTVTRAYT